MADPQSCTGKKQDSSSVERLPQTSLDSYRAETWTRVPACYHMGSMSPQRETYSVYKAAALKPSFQSLVSENSIHTQMN